MRQEELRYKAIAVLLQSGRPMTLREVARGCRGAQKAVRPVLERLVGEGLVVEGELIPGEQAPQYCWAARWEVEAQRQAAGAKQQLRSRIDYGGPAGGPAPELESEPVLAFCCYVLNEYEPPPDKRMLVFLQCSVRRPFSKSPSHGSMRRAISVATGYDPANDFEQCPVHVVVMASKVGPVPYELQDVYPANVRGGGVNHFAPEHFARAKPVLAERMAQYMALHRECYDHISTFTGGRYGEVMREARKLARLDFRVCPEPDGPRLVRMGEHRPRTYWEKYWIQLCLEIIGWLTPTRRKQARARLAQLEVEYE